MYFRLALREIVNNKKFSTFYVLNFTMGLIGLLILLNFKDSLGDSLQERAKKLLTADFSIHARRLLQDDEIQKIEGMFPDKPLDKQRKISLYTMAYSEKGAARLVHVRGVEKGYPFYGQLTFEKEGSLGSSQFFVWPYQETAKQLDLREGETLSFGQKKFSVKNIVVDDTSDSSMGFSLAPRLYVGLGDLLETTLVNSKSTLFDTRYYKFPSHVDLAGLKEKLDKNIDDNTIKFTDPNTKVKSTNRVFGVVNDYLSLVALVAFFLAVLGVNYLVQNYVEKKKKSVAILKSLGMSERGVQQVYLYELIFLSFLSWAFATVFLFISTLVIQKFLPREIQLDIKLISILFGFALSVVGSILISIPFLKRIALLSPAFLLKGSSGGDVDWKKLFPYYIPMILLLIFLAIYLSHSYYLGSIFIFSLLTSFLIFKLFATSVLILLERVHWKSLYLKLFAKAASRNASQFSSAITALGIGVLLFNLLPTIESSLNAELSSPDKNRIPSLFFVDIGEDEIEDVRKHLLSLGTTLKGAAPMIRAKLTSVNGKKFEKSDYNDGFSTREEERERWARNRGFNLTYPINHEWRDYEIVAGKNFSGEYLDENGTGLVEVIVEKRFAERLGVHLEDTLIFDIQGVLLETKILGIRKVKWTSFRPNFFISLQPASMVDAPKSFIGVTEQLNKNERADVILSMAKNFPNVSVVDITRNIDKLLQLIDFLGHVFRSLSLLSILSGLVIIASLANYEAHKRLNEINLLKVLGINQNGLNLINFVHYGFLGGISSIMGGVISLAISYILVELFFDGIWSPQFTNIILSISSVILLTQVISWLSIRSIFKMSPASLLEST